MTWRPSSRKPRLPERPARTRPWRRGPGGAGGPSGGMKMGNCGKLKYVYAFFYFFFNECLMIFGYFCMNLMIFDGCYTMFDDCYMI